MNRRHFLSLLGIGAASIISGVKALAASGAVKRAKPTKDIGYDIDHLRLRQKKEVIDRNGDTWSAYYDPNGRFLNFGVQESIGEVKTIRSTMEAMEKKYRNYPTASWWRI